MMRFVIPVLALLVFLGDATACGRGQRKHRFFHRRGAVPAQYEVQGYQAMPVGKVVPAPKPETLPAGKMPESK